jgi:hypothetical protein
MLAEVTAQQQIIAARGDGAYPASVAERMTAFASAGPQPLVDHPELVEAATYPDTISTAAQALNRHHGRRSGARSAGPPAQSPDGPD